MTVNYTSTPVCNNITGQCPCHPHVIGPTCDRCEGNYFGFTTGTGCEPCNCDPVGSNSEQCNESSGQCDCKSGYFGRRCEVQIFDGNKDLLKHIDKLADEVKPNTQQDNKNLNYSSFATNVTENSTKITWTGGIVDAPQVTILEYAVSQLADSSIKIVVFEEKNKSELTGDLVVIKTTAIKESLYKEALLQIKFTRKKLLYPNNPNWKCVYWDSNISKWSDYGITTMKKSDFSIKCSSYHMSTFTVLLPDPGQRLLKTWYDQESHHFWLTYITKIGSWITICFLILVILINFRKKTGNETRKILVNSSVALLFAHCTYQMHTYFHEYYRCLIISFMKYYFVLAFLLWTAADGINMWRILLADVFNTRGHIFYQWYRVISWGLPMMTTSIGIFFFRSQGKCELKFNPTYDLIFFMVPFIIILCCNLLLFIWMLVNMTNKDMLGRLRNKKIDYVLALTQVFGIGWCVVFPFLYIKPTRLVAEYVLAGVISTQGLLIFIVRCGIDKSLRNKLKEKSSSVSRWLRNSLPQSSDGSVHKYKKQKNISAVELDTASRGNSETN